MIDGHAMNETDITIVMPCLNEEQTLGECIAGAQQALAELGGRGEILISDNGSTDNSIAIAEKLGARVVSCATRGYGAALQQGILCSRGDVVVFADADATYDFAETPVLVRKIREGNDLVYGSRLHGQIEPGAMPFLHRHLGTPVLNFFINRLHARKGTRISDCNSGFRCFRKAAFLSWDVRSTGMEFASEMMVKALKAGAAIADVPISLKPGLRGRQPHLKTWRDGMRHLLQIFLESPEFFYKTGRSVFALSWLSLIIGYFAGPVPLGFVSLFGLHTMMFALLGSTLGLALLGIGLFLATKIPNKVSLYQTLIDLPEDRLFWSSMAFIGLSLVFFVFIFIQWAANSFTALALQKETLMFTAFGTNGLLATLHVITAHLIRRA